MVLVTVIMKLLVLVCLISCSLAAKVCLPYDTVVEWTFTDNSTVTFTYTITKDTWDNYQWGGIGFKYLDDGPQMYGADIHFLEYGKLTEDRYAHFNGKPLLDTVYDAHEDNFDRTLSEITLTYTWSKPVDSQDGVYDKVYTKDSALIFMWARGTISGAHGSDPDKHSDENVGSFEIVFSEDYTRDCSESFLQRN